MNMCQFVSCLSAREREELKSKLYSHETLYCRVTLEERKMDRIAAIKSIRSRLCVDLRTAKAIWDRELERELSS